MRFSGDRNGLLIPDREMVYKRGICEGLMHRTTGGGGVEIQQPPFGTVIVLYPFTGGIYDVKGNAYTGGSGLTTSAAAHKWGGDSCRFPGPSGSSARAIVPTLSGSGPGTGDFCIDGWVNFDSFDARRNIMSIGGNSGIGIYAATSGQLVVASGGGTGGGDILAGSTAMTPGAWHFVRCARISGAVYLGLDGNIEGSVVFGTNFSLATCYIGAYNNNYASLMVGYMQDIRYCIGWGGPANEVPSGPFPTS